MKAEQIYEFIVAFVRKNGFLPTYQEIVDGIGAKSKSVVKPKLLELERKGLVKFEEQTSRYALTEYHMAKLGGEGDTIKGKVKLQSGETDVTVMITDGKIELYFPEECNLDNWYHAVHVNTLQEKGGG